MDLKNHEIRVQRYLNIPEGSTHARTGMSSRVIVLSVFLCFCCWKVLKELCRARFQQQQYSISTLPVTGTNFACGEMFGCILSFLLCLIWLRLSLNVLLEVRLNFLRKEEEYDLVKETNKLINIILNILDSETLRNPGSRFTHFSQRKASVKGWDNQK